MEKDKVIFGLVDIVWPSGNELRNIIRNNESAESKPEIQAGKTVATEKQSKDASKDKFACFARFAGDSLPDEEGQRSRLADLPSIPKEIFAKLPKLLQEGCKVFNDEKERDVFLTGSLGVLSGCISPIWGTYDQRVVYANLNCFAVAPAASGKGALVFAKAMGQAYHDKIYRESKDEIKQYERLKKALLDGQAEAMEEPTLKLLYIPGNVSSAALIKNLQDSDGKGVLCETEADTIANALR